MNEKNLTTKEAGEQLGKKPRLIRGLIHRGELPAFRVGRQFRIPQSAIDDYKLRHQTTPLGRAVISRRTFLKRAGIAVASGAAGSLIASQLLYSYRKYLNEKAEEAEAKSLFGEIFGRLSPTPSTSIGKMYPSETGYQYHPDNLAAGSVLIEPLQLLDFAQGVEATDWAMAVELGRDFVVIGGANSTPASMIAWEFEGPNDRELTRRPSPFIPLRYYGISDVTDPAVAQDVPIAWRLEGQGFVSSANWHLVDTEREEGNNRIRVQPGIRVALETGDAYLPRDNFLVVTRLPNFLSPEFGDLDPSLWPQLLVFEGMHGPGTRAVELLLSAAGLEALRSAKTHLGPTTAYQLLFRATDLDITTGGFHKFHAIELMDVVSLDKIGINRYQKAHRYAKNRIERLLH